MPGIPPVFATRMDLAVEEFARTGKINPAARRYRMTEMTLRKRLVELGMVPATPRPRARANRRDSVLLSPEEEAAIKFCPHCNLVHLYDPCEWCRYLYKRPEARPRKPRKKLRPSRDRRFNKKPKKPWFHNPDPWGDRDPRNA